ncbi:MAG: HAMP domain-containing histidine kinase [Sphingomonas sp.]|nr:HAMP domain-containing histidine kinase [Sphingomonas sp.]
MVLRAQSIANAEASAEIIRDDLRATFAQGGVRALSHAIDLRTERASGRAMMLLIDSTGRPIAGNLAAMPAGVSTDSDYRQLDVRRVGRPLPEAALLRLTRLPGGGRLISGVAYEGERLLLGRLERVSLAAMVLGLVFAAIAAALAARLIGARLRSTVTTLHDVRAGDLARRVPEDRSGDAFAMLGGEVNRTLDRIAALVGELKIATDGLAHDLKSPLTRMRVALERAAREITEPDAQDAMQRALEEGDRLMAIVETALSISRAEAGVGRDSFAVTRIDTLLETLGEIYAPLVEEGGRELMVDAQPGVTRAVHRQLLGQAVGNLIENAVKYGRGAIVLTLAEHADGIALSVRDHGPGIAEGQRAEALRRFGRLDAARQGSGAGLGLSLVQAVAHLHDGSVELGDAGPGLVVTLRFP